MKELYTLKLKCSLCQAKDFEAYVVQSPEQVQKFLIGEPLENMGERIYRGGGRPDF